MIVAFLERGDGEAPFLDVSKDAAVNGLFLERAVEALGDAVGLRLSNEGEAWRDAPELDLVEEVVGGVLRAIVHAQGQAASGIGAGGAELCLETLGNWLQGREAVADLGGMDADAAGIEMIDGREYPDPVFIDGLDADAIGAPISLGRCMARVPSCSTGAPCGRRCGESNEFSRIRRNTRPRPTRMLPRRRNRAQTLRGPSPVKGEAARSSRMAVRRSASDPFGFGPRRAGWSGTTGGACRSPGRRS